MSRKDPKFLRQRQNQHRKFVDEARALATTDTVDPVARIEQMRNLTHEFIKSRLVGASAIEGAKAKAVNKLIESIDKMDNPRLLLQVIQVLDEQSAKDFTIMAEQGRGGGSSKPGAVGDPGNIFNVFMGGGSGGGQPTQAPGTVTREIAGLMDAVLQITEVIAHNKQKSPVDFIDGEAVTK